MVNKGFPTFGMSQAGSYIAALRNYNLPDFILKKIAKECGSSLLERGRLDDRLQSMNDTALTTLHRIFIDCESDSDGKFADYGFYAYVASMFHKCDIFINESIPWPATPSRPSSMGCPRLQRTRIGLQAAINEFYKNRSQTG